MPLPTRRACMPICPAKPPRRIEDFNDKLLADVATSTP